MKGKKPKLLLVQPTTVHLDGTPHKTRWRLIMGLMIPLMAGLTPDDFDVTLCDERLEDIDFDGGWDLVGMTTTIGASLRAYQLGDEFRKRGIPVVFGGFHATLQTEEALHHCDAVVQGEADLVWPELLQDWRDGKLKQIYKADKVHDLKNLPRPRHELLKLNRYLFKAVPVQASRGCPYRCSFCEIPVFYDGAYRTRPIEDIVEEIKQVVKITGFKRFQFIDDQITGKHKFARELFKALEPLNIRFSCLWTINSNHDDELLELAAKAGIFHVNIGVESISQESLLSMNKIQNHAGQYKKLLKKLEKYGIYYSLNFLFGLEEDHPGIFDATLKFLHEVKAPEAFFNTVTPRRGTPMRTQLENEGRVIIPDADLYTNNFRCMFVPKNMSPQEVEEGVWRCTKEFYSLKSMFKRLLMPPGKFTWQGLTENMLFYWGAKRQIDPVDYDQTDLLLKTFAILVLAAILEVGGDALIRIGLRGPGYSIVAGALTLFAYGVVVNLSGVDFNRLMGIYIAVFFVVSQAISFILFKQIPDDRILLGGGFIVTGGLLILLMT